MSTGSTWRAGIVTILLATGLISGPAGVDQAVAQSAEPAVEMTERIAGGSRAATAAALSARTYPDGADTVVIAREDAYPDALAGGPLAASLSAPLLLSTSEVLGEATADEVERLGADTAVLLGGTAALSAAVEDGLDSLGVDSVRRISGDDRFATAAAIADELGEADAAYLTRGADTDDQDGWPDAVAVGALAAAQQRPILLAGADDQLPAGTAEALSGSTIGSVVLVGGTAVLSDALATQVADTGVSVSRIAGSTRLGTAAAVATTAVGDGADPARLWLATAQDFPDALAAGPAAAADGGVLLLVNPSLEHSPEVADWLARHGHEMTGVRIVGGVHAVPAALEHQAAQLLVSDRSTAQRIRSAYATGELSVDDAARYSLYSALDPEAVPEAYRAPIDADDQSHDTSLDLLAWWDELQPETQEELAPYLDVQPVDEQDAEEQSFDQDEEWSDCTGTSHVLAGILLPCASATELDGDGDTDFTVYYGIGTGGVPDEDADGNDRPDLVDLVERSAAAAWTTYVDLGFPAPDHVTIAMDHAMLPGAGLALPFNRTIYLDTDATFVTPYLPRHELFHQFQYEHIGTAEIAANRDAMIWWMEATANWAAGEANRVAAPIDQAGGHTRSLPEVLGEPELRFDEARGFSGGPEYGSFIVAEYLAERFDGAATILQTWERSGGGLLGRNPTDVVADVLADGDGFATEMMRYRQWSYVLERQQGIGFTTPDVDRYWRDELQDDSRTQADAADHARPRRAEAVVELNRLGPDGFTPLDPTGATYVDLDIPAEATEVEITVATDSPDVHASVLGFTDYPAMCRPPTDLTRAEDQNLAITLDHDPACTTLTLVIANTSRGSAHSVFWRAQATGTELVLSGEGLADDIRFGDGVQATIDALSAVLGQPDEDSGWVEGCPFDGPGALNERFVSFGDLAARFYDDGSSQYFRGWAYSPDDGHGLRTDRDIGPPSTNAEMAAAYPEASYSDATFGPMWSVPSEADGPMFAFPADGDPATPIGQMYGGTGVFCE